MKRTTATLTDQPPLRRLAPSRLSPRAMFAPDDRIGRRDVAEADRIMVVEDDFLIATAIEEALREAGFAIAGIANSAQEALDIAAKAAPLLAVMDIRLNGKRDGIDAALDLFGRHGVRCIFASAHQTLEARQRAAPARPLAWLPKPYTMTSLIETVRSAVAELRPSPK